MMLYVGEGHSNNHQIIFTLFGYYIFCNYLWHREILTGMQIKAGYESTFTRLIK